MQKIKKCYRFQNNPKAINSYASMYTFLKFINFLQRVL